jgi:uncharacterized protein
MIIDAHVHLFPDRMFDAIRQWFDTYAWQIKYKLYSEDCLKLLGANGIEKVVSYNYAHKPGVASYLNEWNHILKQTHPDIAVFGAIHPDDENIKQELGRILGPYGFKGIKMHCHVISRAPDHESFFPIYEKVCEYGKVLTIHAGTAPGLKGYGSITVAVSGTDKIYNFMKRFPDMKCIVPHLGAEEYDAFFGLMGEFKNLWTDTTMTLANLFGKQPPVESIVRYQDRILYGSDFPNIPYDLMTEINNIKTLELGKEVEDKLFFKNVQRLLGTW